MMKNRDDQKFRRLALANWLESNGGMKSIAREKNLAPTTRSQVSSVLRGYNFGKVAARNLEKKLGIPEGWLDAVENSEESDGRQIFEDVSLRQCDESQESVTDSLTLSRETICIPNFSIDNLPILYRHQRAYRSAKSFISIDERPCLITNMHVSLAYLNKHIPKTTSLKNLRVITTSENSTYPPFSAGDPMFIDLGIKSVEADGTYLFKLNGMNLVKRLLRTENREIRVMHSDELYDSWVVTPNMDLKIFGAIIKIWRSDTF